MAYEYTITLGNLGPRDRDISSTDLTPPAITYPSGYGWKLVETNITPQEIYYFWQRGGTTVNITDNYTILSSDEYILCDATISSLTVTLPSSPANGEIVTIKKTDSTGNTVTVDGNGYNVDGQSTHIISTQYDFIKILYNTEWYIV